MFKESLQKFVDNVEGGIAGLVMGFDGVAVEIYTREGHKIDINTVGMEFSFILTQVRKAPRELSGPAVSSPPPAAPLNVGGVSVAAIRELADIVAEQGLSELKVAHDGGVLVLRRGPGGAGAAATVMHAVPAAASTLHAAPPPAPLHPSIVAVPPPFAPPASSHAADQEGPHRQSRRDRAARHPRLPRDGAPDGVGALRRRQGRAARRVRRRERVPRPVAGQQSYSSG